MTRTEAEIRGVAFHSYGPCEDRHCPFCACADAVAMLDELRAEVDAFRVRLFEEYQRQQISANIWPVERNGVARSKAEALLSVYNDGLRSRLFPMDEDRWQAQFGEVKE